LELQLGTRESHVLMHLGTTFGQGALVADDKAVVTALGETSVVLMLASWEGPEPAWYELIEGEVVEAIE
jgi:hypothetical protein